MLLETVSYLQFFYPFQLSQRWKLFDRAGERERTLKCDCRILLSGFVWSALGTAAAVCKNLLSECEQFSVDSVR